jgi:hypothetical protein
VAYLRIKVLYLGIEMNESSPEDRLNLLVAQIGSYVGNEGAFGNGAAYKGTNRNGDVSMSGRGWWMFGGDTPELQFIAITLLGLSPSSCPVEQSFSQQNNIHTLIRNRLAHDKV